jgi:hypothetical protein
VRDPQVTVRGVEAPCGAEPLPPRRRRLLDQQQLQLGQDVVGGPSGQRDGEFVGQRHGVFGGTALGPLQVQRHAQFLVMRP